MMLIVSLDSQQSPSIRHAVSQEVCSHDFGFHLRTKMYPSATSTAPNTVLQTTASESTPANSAPRPAREPPIPNNATSGTAQQATHATAATPNHFHVERADCILNSNRWTRPESEAGG